MRVLTTALTGAALCCFASTSAFAAVTVASTDFGFAPPAGADALVDFDSALPSSFSLSGGSVRNVDDSLGAFPAIAPNVKESSYYLSANAGDAATLMSTQGYREVSLYWGSIDSYNTISLLDELGNAFQSYTGADIIAAANGNQFVSETNRRVTFATNGLTSAIYGLKFESSSPAFEVDNIAFSGAVPEPTTWAMMIVGIGLVGGAMRRRQRLSYAPSFG